MKLNMQRLRIIAGIAVPSIVVLWCCTKPTKDFVINVSSNILTHTATLQFADAAQEDIRPTGLTVELGSADAGSIYDYSGYKELKLSGSTLTVGVDPKSTPVGDNTLSFFIKAAARDYLPVNVPVTIGSTNRNQNFAVNMININNPPDGVVAVQPAAAITAGTATSTITVATTTNASTTTTATVTIPAGTQLRSATGGVIAGSSVKVVLADFDPIQPAAALALPGGPMQTEVVGGPSPSVYLLPAGFATVIMTVNNTEVKFFNNPITMQIGLNATTFNPLTNTAIKAGDVMDIYSYQVETGVWTYEAPVTVSMSAGRLVANFTTNHLCTFLVHVRCNIIPCNRPLITFNAPSIDANSSDQFIVDVYPTGIGNNPRPAVSQYVTIHNGDSLILPRLPSGNLTVRVSLVDYDHYRLSDYRNRGTQVSGRTFNACAAGTQPTVFNVNYSPGAYMRGTGIAVCPNDNSRIYLPPDGAQVYYRRSGSGDNFRILGVVVNEAITTSKLVSGATYDIQGNFAGKLIGRPNILIVPGKIFLDTAHILNSNNSTFCP